MPFDQTKDVLRHARKFHRRLSEFYEDLKDSVARERTRALLDHLSRHEDYLADTLAKFQKTAPENVLDAFINYKPDTANISVIADFEIKEDMKVDDVITAAMHFDACLIKFYADMARKTNSAKVREMFENLLAMEQNEQLELSKQTLEFAAI